MARWIHELGTNKFEVLHLPGKGHSNAEGLSRVPYKQCGRMDEEETPERRNMVATVVCGKEGWEDVIQHQAGDSCVGLRLEACRGGPRHFPLRDRLKL